MCTMTTDARPVSFAAGASTIKVLDYDQRRTALILNLNLATMVGGDVELEAALASAAGEGTYVGVVDAHTGTIEGEVAAHVGTEEGNMNVVSGDYDGTTTEEAADITGEVAETAADEGGTLALDPLAISGPIIGSITGGATAVGLLKTDPSHPGIPLYPMDSPLILDRKVLYDLLNGPWYWDDLGTGATLSGYDIIETGPTPN